MPLVKLHVSAGMAAERRAALVREVRETMVQTLGIRPEVGHVMLYESAAGDRTAHANVNGQFVWVEVLMYAGRSPELKQTLLGALLRVVQAHTGLAALDVNLVILESDATNWAGGK
ncbi:MAG TPA: tautomerase family protein [Symbiobacteriaceae bacterium]|jgi:phenylpyruvate tautomerase PptA (4-oxalocrotonate tautomerase family)